ncbi:lyase family protein [Acrocarpospora catenulata]|uniref:lyase family protein n=1 Tax=Acrocarpospora catenulata TaxID=2836182 RepID=UPI00202396C6|nr:lyase family protein [Acrocarpospora catenulata]
MTSDEAGDFGLTAPIWAGTPAEAATGDLAFLRALLDAEVALAGITSTDISDIAAAADELLPHAVRDLARRAAPAGGNPVIPLVKALTEAVAARNPAAAESVHLGATSQDIMDTAFMLVASRTRTGLLADLTRAASALEHLAAEHAHTPMAARTLTQQALPTTFGLKAAGWRDLVLDAHDRLASVVLPAQLGGAAGTLAAFGAELPPESVLALPDAFAAELGLAPPRLPWHTLRTPVAELGTALAVTVGSLGKLAADVLVLTRTEIGELAEGSGGGSSALPHKSNPVRATLIAAAARTAPALAAVLLGSLAAEDERPAGAWHAEWLPLRDLLRLAGGAAHHAAVLAEGLRVNPGRMRDNLAFTRGLVTAEHVAAGLAPILGRRQARDLVTTASRKAAAAGIPLRVTLDEELGPLTGHPSPELLDELCDPAAYLGSAPALTLRALARRPAGG